MADDNGTTRGPGGQRREERDKKNDPILAAAQVSEPALVERLHDLRDEINGIAGGIYGLLSTNEMEGTTRDAARLLERVAERAAGQLDALAEELHGAANGEINR